MGDFRVSRGSTVIAASASTATITEGTDYTADAAGSAWVRITSTRLSGGGKTSGGGLENSQEFMVWVSDPTNIETSITFERYIAGPTDCRIDWEVVEYVGNPGGPNEVKVRDADATAFASGSGTFDNLPPIIVPGPIGGWEDIAKASALITGQAVDLPSRNSTNSGLFATQVLSADGAIRIARARTNGDATASWVALEFTGSNWRDVQRHSFLGSGTGTTPWTSGSPGNSGTEAIPIALLDASKAFLHVQFKNRSTFASGVDDFGDNVELTASTTLLTHRRTTSTEAAKKTMVVWIFENTQAGAGEMSVEHVAYHESDVTGPEEKTTAITVSSATLAESSIFGECASALATGPGTPRSFNPVSLDGRTSVGVNRSDTGIEERWGFDVVQWPTAPIEVTPDPIKLRLHGVDPVAQVGVVVTPGPIALALGAMAPLVRVAVGATPAPILLKLQLIDPVAQTGLEVTPGPVVLELRAAGPLARVGVGVTPAPILLGFKGVRPTVKVGVEVTPAPVALELRGIAPLARVGVGVAPPPIVLGLGAPDPLVEIGVTAVEVRPGPIFLKLQLIAPVVQVGVGVLPGPVVLELRAIDGAVSTGPGQGKVCEHELRVRLLLGLLLTACTEVALEREVVREFSVVLAAVPVVELEGRVARSISFVLVINC